MKNTDQTLADILTLITRDVKLISANFQDVVLDPQTAQTLCRYASTLSGIKQDQYKDLEKEKKELNKLSDEELKELLLKLDQKA